MHQSMIQSYSGNSEKSKFHWLTFLSVGAVHGLALLAPWFFSSPALAVALILHWLCGSIGICLGYHRLLSHRSLQLPKWLEYAVITFGVLALEGGPIFWVAGHRRHHAYTENDMKDPYSANRGFWWSHILWLFYQSPEFFNYSNYKKFAPDVDRDPYYRWLNQYPVIPQILLGLLLLGWGGWSFVIYGIFLRTVLLWHSTWLINSASHLWGYRTFVSNDNARNLWWAALLTYGEGWHNNHHSQPQAAKAGQQWWEIDMTWWVIRGLELLGLARKVVRRTGVEFVENLPSRLASRREAPRSTR